MPSEESYVSYQNYIRPMKLPFVVYADCECFTAKGGPESTKAGVDGIMQQLRRMMKTTIQKVEGGEPSEPDTKILQKQVPSGCCYHIK